MPILNPKLDHPAYHVWVKLPKYNCCVNVVHAATKLDRARVLCRANPAWTPSDHLALADLHAMEAGRQLVHYNELLEQATQETFGRPYRFNDFRCSAIASEEFSSKHKNALRFAAHAQAYHTVVAQAHMRAARRRKVFF